jgi:hypothetical protein
MKSANDFLRFFVLTQTINKRANDMSLYTIQKFREFESNVVSLEERHIRRMSCRERKRILRIDNNDQRTSKDKICLQLFERRNVFQSNKIVNVIAFSSLSLLSISKIFYLEFLFQNLFEKQAKSTIQILDHDVRIFL